MNQNIHDILGRLKKVRRGSNGNYTACCPAHKDRSPSLSITEKDGRILLHCFTGCDSQSIRAALGLSNGQYFAPIRLPAPKPPEPTIPNFDALFTKWQEQTDFHHLDGFAMSLGVTTDALQLIGCAWADSHRAFAFPMYDAHRKMIGIRLRNDKGEKWAIRGSHQGLFMPATNGDPLLFIVEGPTDEAAALSIGLSAIGRPSCVGQEPMILQFIREHEIKRTVFVVDNDEPGWRGAQKLQAMLKTPSCLWIPPAKDLRDFVRFGGDRATAESAINDLIWRRP